MKQQNLLKHSNIGVSIRIFSKISFIFFILLSVSGCKKGTVPPSNSENGNNKITQNYLQHKLDSLVQLAPKSVKINKADSTIVIELQNGTIIKNKLTKFSLSPNISQTSKIETQKIKVQWDPADGIPGNSVPGSVSWASLVPDVLGASTSWVKMDANYMKAFNTIVRVDSFSQTFFGGSYQRTNSDGSTTTELGVALLNAHTYYDTATAFPASNVPCLFIGDAGYQITVAYPGLTPVTSNQTVSYAIQEIIYP